MDLMNQVKQFRKQMQNVNPNEEINRLLHSGQISQQQLNQAQQTANQFMNMFGNIK